MARVLTNLLALRTSMERARADGHERGAGLVEYALLVGLIALVCISAVTLFGSATSSQFSSMSDMFP